LQSAIASVVVCASVVVLTMRVLTMSTVFHRWHAMRQNALSAHTTVVVRDAGVQAANSTPEYEPPPRATGRHLPPPKNTIDLAPLANISHLVGSLATHVKAAVEHHVKEASVAVEQPDDIAAPATTATTQSLPEAAAPSSNKVIRLGLLLTIWTSGQHDVFIFALQFSSAWRWRLRWSR
jgi:hypothetical protein